MDFNEYQKQAESVADYPIIGARFVYPALGLANEAGEVAGKIKKIFRDDGGVVTPERLEAIKKELGDVLWYLAATSSALGFTLEEVAKLNLDRLQSRKERGVIHGDGDNR